MKKTTFQTQLKAGALALALATLPVGAQAAGLGKLTVFSVIGQPLRAEIDITASRDEIASLRARIASHEAFQRAGIDYASVLNNIHVSIDQRADGRPYLQLRSDNAIYDPFLDVLLEVNWTSGMLVREYTFLLDPPDSLNKTTAQVDPVSPPVVTTPATKKTITEKPPAAAPSAKAPGKTRQTVKLPPRETPAEETAPPSPEQTASTHQVKQGENLRRIASKLQPEGVNLDQMLLAIFRQNKEAFDSGNINRLKAGKILSIPDATTAASIDAREARQFVVAQSADFSAYRRKLAAATAAAPAPRDETAGQSSSGKIAPQVEDKAPAVAGKDKLEISRAAAARGGEAKTATAHAAAKEEDKLAREKALKEANSRAAELDKNLADMKKLLELKNQGMAQTQKQAQAAKATPPAAPAPAPITPPPATAQQTPPAPAATAATAATKPAEIKPAEAKPAEPVAEKPAEPIATPSAAPAAPEAPKAEEKPAEVKPPVKPLRKKLAPPPPPEEPDFIEANPELLMGGGGILALLLGYLGFNLWKKKRKPAEEKKALDTTGPSSQSEPSINSVFGNASGQTVDTGSNLGNSSLDADFSVASVGGVESNEGVDPIAEADVYMAYGRNAQAEEILLDALKNEPTRHAIHIKLLDIYAARKSLKQFETIATDLHDQTGGSGDEWDQAVILGKQIDPDNPLYSDGAPAPVAEDEYDPAATMVMTTDEMEQLARDLAAPGGAGNGETAAEETAESLDFEIDLGGDSVLEPAGDDTSAHQTTDTDSVMNFDLGVGEPAEVIETPAAAADASNDNGMDFDLDIAPPSSGKLGSPEEDGLKFEMSDTGKADAPATPSALSVDLSAINLDLEAPPVAAVPAPEVPLEIPPLSPAAEALSTPLSFAESTPAADDTPGSPEVDTKLELAAAYEEMGDKDGARELLREVLNEGNAAQKAAASSKLEQLG